jgi:hypothetical protein
MITTFYGFWDEWQLYHKVTFDGINKMIYVNPGVTELLVGIDIYSDWKEWVAIRDHAKFEQAMRAVGGDPLPGEDTLGATYFLTNGWRIQTWDGDHSLDVVGNLYTEEGESPFIPTTGPYTVLIAQRVSNLVDKVGFPSPGDLAAAVWDKMVSEHVEEGTFGERVGKKKVFVNTEDLSVEVD